MPDYADGSKDGGNRWNARQCERRKPVADTGIKTLTGETNHQSFDGVGLPGFQFVQDPVEYGTRTHLSSMDTYERVQDEEVKLNSAVPAAFAIHPANRPDLFPRKTASKIAPSYAVSVYAQSHGLRLRARACTSWA